MYDGSLGPGVIGIVGRRIGVGVGDCGLSTEPILEPKQLT